MYDCAPLYVGEGVSASEVVELDWGALKPELSKFTAQHTKDLAQVCQ